MRSVRIVLLMSVVTMTSGFKIVSPEELAQIRNQGSAPEVDTSSLFYDDIAPWATSSSLGLDELLSAIDDQGFSEACQEHGVQESQAFPCTFWVQVSGVVDSVDTSSRVGKIMLSVGEKDVEILTGPVIPGTGIRDGYPEIDYSDFGNQDAFANLSDDLNRESVSLVEDIGEITPGDNVSALGAYSTWDGMDDSIQIVPVAIDHSREQ
jgi:predicted lipoprotein